MEARVRERLVGALVLVAIVVLLVPAILKGRDPEPAPAREAAPTQRVEVPIGDAAPAPEEQVLVPEPTKPDAPQAARAPEPEPATVSQRATDSGRAPAAAPKPAPKPEREAEAPTPVAQKPAPAPAAPASAWAVQLGAFSNRSKAEQLVAELKKRRYAAFIIEYRASGQVLYRVRVGPEQDRARAAETASRLAKDGFQPVVARHP
jgi:DedD protein